jgi:hypothetical protein
MRKTILAIFGVGLIVVSTAQIAAASEHHGRKTPRAPAPTGQQFRDARDSAAWSAQPGGYYSGGFSAPAGH